MGNRLELQALLESVLGSRNVYFQPPESIKLNYPCIVYSRSRGLTDFADDLPYRRSVGYKVTIIDRDPDSLIPEKVATLPRSSFSTHFKADNLNHDVYNVYY